MCNNPLAVAHSRLKILHFYKLRWLNKCGASSSGSLTHRNALYNFLDYFASLFVHSDFSHESRYFMYRLKLDNSVICASCKKQCLFLLAKPQWKDAYSHVNKTKTITTIFIVQKSKTRKMWLYIKPATLPHTRRLRPLRSVVYLRILAATKISKCLGSNPQKRAPVWRWR